MDACSSKIGVREVSVNVMIVGLGCAVLVAAGWSMEAHAASNVRVKPTARNIIFRTMGQILRS
jgi:hypothetical protein